MSKRKIISVRFGAYAYGKPTIMVSREFPSGQHFYKPSLTSCQRMLRVLMYYYNGNIVA